MRAGVMSAGQFGIASRRAVSVQELEVASSAVSLAEEWSEEAFARAQIRNLVRQVFRPDAIPDVRQVVFGAVEPETDVNEICWSVGQTLASEVSKDVVVVTSEIGDSGHGSGWGLCVRNDAVHAGENLWRLVLPRGAKSVASSEALRQLLQEARCKFTYSIVAGSVGAGHGSASLGQLADGLVLVISALRTRRVTARKLLDDLGRVRVLGTVLQDREFPIPEKIYRRL